MRRPAPARPIVPALVLALLLAATWRGAAAEPPIQLALAGGPLVRVGEAVRERLWVDLYRVGLYLPADRSDPDLAARRDVAKAVRFEVLFEGELPEAIPDEWAATLLPPLEPPDRERLLRSYRSLTAGDELLFSYAPGRGSRLALNGSPVVATGDGRFMDAVVSLFLGPDAVSSKVRSALRGEADDESGSPVRNAPDR